VKRYGRFRSSEWYAEYTPLWVWCDFVFPFEKVEMVISSMKVPYSACQSESAVVKVASSVFVSVRERTSKALPASVFGRVVIYRVTIFI